MLRRIARKIDWDFLFYYALGLWLAWGAWTDYTEGKDTSEFSLFAALLCVIAAEAGRIRKTIKEAHDAEPKA